MKKDNIRDYATEAFRFYAACGRLTSEQLKQKVYDDIYTDSKKEFYRSGSGMPADATAYAAIKADEAMKDMESEFRDIIAVEKTLMQLRRQQKRAVEIVYFTEPNKPLEKGTISSRVHKAELELYASERSIYEWLAGARRIFAKERGLRITKKEFKKVCSSRPKKCDIMVPSKSEGEKNEAEFDRR